MKKILLIGVTLIIVLILVIGGIFIYSQLQSHEKAAPVEKPGPVYETKEYIVNLSGAPNRFIKTQFALELSNEKAKIEIEEKKHMLQDMVIMLLSRQSLEELSTAEGKEKLKNDMINAINEFLKEGKAHKVYILQIIFT